MKTQNFLLIGVVALLACGDDRTSSERAGERTLPPVAGNPPAAGEPSAASERLPAATAWAQVEPVDGADTANVRGTIRFEPSTDGLRVRAELEGLPPGKHGFHVHEGTSCSEPGTHFAFDPEAGDERIHGNLGELSVDSTGRADFEGVVREAQIEGARSIVGRAVVVHAEENDESSPPDGGAGPAIACGVIQAKQDVSSALLQGVGTKQ